MKKLTLIGILLLLFAGESTAGTEAKRDSLWQVWKNTANSDSSRLNALSDVAWTLIYNHPDSSKKLANKEMEYARQQDMKYWVADALNTLGGANWIQGNYDKALSFYKRALLEFKALEDNKGISDAYNNIGAIQHMRGNYPEAVEYYRKSLELDRQRGSKKGVAAAHANIGLTHSDQGNHPKAIERYHKALDLYKEIDDRSGMATIYNKIGLIHQKQKNYDDAQVQFEKSLAIQKELGNENGISRLYNNLGILLSKRGDQEKARLNYRKALEYKKKIGNKNGQAITYKNLGESWFASKELEKAKKFYQKSLNLYRQLGRKKSIASAFANIGKIELEQGYPQKALNKCSKGLLIADSIQVMEEVKINCKCLYETYKHLGNKAKSLQFYERYITARDSLINKERTREIAKKEARFKYRQKALADSIQNAEKQKLKNARIKAQEAQLEQERTQRYALYGGLLLALLAAGIIFSRFRTSQHQKKVIEKQKLIVEEKQKEIMDSINYAQRIQNALLKAEDHVSQNLPPHFIYFQPKDVVSGDFYWVLEKQQYLYLTIADCTGHGVPGAFLTMLGTSFLNEINATTETLPPSSILEKLNERFIKELSQAEEEANFRDGMDIALVRLDLEKRELLYAGANNPIYLISEKDDPEIQELHPDKQPIGYSPNPQPFHDQKITIEKDTLLYLFSDGYPDQFGGPKGKKFKYQALKDLLLTIHSLPMEEQKNQLEKTFQEWKKDLEQVDDICVMGIKI